MSEPGPEGLKSPSKIPSLDALRGIACSMVLLAHLNRMPGLHWIPQMAATAGVGIFFVLSGFLITRILIHRKKAGSGLNGFYSRRVARILPIYFLVLLVLLAVRPAPEILWAAFFIFNLYYVTNLQEYYLVDATGPVRPPLGHFWSLCVEEHFYWVWPIVLGLLGKRMLSFLLIGLVGLSPLLTKILIAQLMARNFPLEAIHGLVWRLTPTNVAALCLGSLAALHEAALFRTFALAGVRFAVLPVVSAGLFLLFGAGWWGSHLPGVTCEQQLAVHPTLLHIGCAGIFGVALWSRTLSRIPLVQGIGRISYGLYMYHLPVFAAMGLVSSTTPITVPAGLAALALTVGVSWLSYVALEVKILNWEHRHGERGWRIACGRLRIAPASLLTLALAIGCLIGMGQWLHLHRKVPAEWRRSVIEVPGASFAYRWMGVTHAQDQFGFRRLGLPGPAAPGQKRIALVGDSVVYGQAVEETQVVSRQVQDILRQRGVDNETLNMGKAGVQAEDLPGLLAEHVFPLQPDVIVYVANVTDFIPSGESWEGHTIREILACPDCATRFGDAVTAAWRACRERDISFLAIATVATPSDGDEVAFARFAETLFRSLSIPYISVESFLAAEGPPSYVLNQWEKHPNAAWHHIYGELIASRLATNELVRAPASEQGEPSSP